MIPSPHEMQFVYFFFRSFSFCLFVSRTMEDDTVSLCDNWPPPLPALPLRRSLQCCSLLNYYQWVWRDTCSLSFLSLSPSWQPRTQTHTCTQTFGLHFHLTWICWMLSKRRWGLYCAKRRWGRSMPSRAYSRLMGITLRRRHRSAYGQAWMHRRAHTNTDASLRSKAVLIFFFLFFFTASCHKSYTPNKVIILDLAVPNIINGGGTQVLCHGAVSILTHADIYS